MSRHKNVAKLVLEALIKSPGASVSDLAKMIGASRQCTKVEVGRLWDYGLIISRPGVGNKKSLFIRPEVGEIVEQNTSLPSNCLPTAFQLPSSWRNIDPAKVWEEFEAKIANLDPSKIHHHKILLLFATVFKLTSFKSTSFLLSILLDGGVPSMKEETSPLKEGTSPMGEETSSMKRKTSPLKEGTSPEVAKKISSTVSEECSFAKSIPKEEPVDLERLCFFEKVKHSIEIPEEYKVWRLRDESNSDFKHNMKQCEGTLYPAYMGLHPFARDILFAEAYGELLAEIGVSDMHLVLKEMGDYRIGMENRGRWKFIKRARLWADLNNAKYKDWVTGVYWYYKKGHIKIKGKDGALMVVEVPFAKSLSGETARVAYFSHYHNEIEKSMRLERREIERLNIHLLPENYTGAELQNRFGISVLAEAKMKAAENGKPVEKEVTKYIKKRILSREVAENPTLNARSCPGYICPLEKEEE